LPYKYKHIVVVIEETKKIFRYTIHELMGFYEADKQKINQYSKQPLDKHFTSKQIFFGRKATIRE
jgi:hypothetical protein